MITGSFGPYNTFCPPTHGTERIGDLGAVCRTQIHLLRLRNRLTSPTDPNNVVPVVRRRAVGCLVPILSRKLSPAHMESCTHRARRVHIIQNTCSCFTLASCASICDCVVLGGCGIGSLTVGAFLVSSGGDSFDLALFLLLFLLDFFSFLSPFSVVR